MTPAVIIDAVCTVHGVTPEALRGSARPNYVTAARHLAMLLLRRMLPELSLADIGHALGRRDHTSVLHGCRRARAQMKESLAWRKRYVRCRALALGREVDVDSLKARVQSLRRELDERRARCLALDAELEQSKEYVAMLEKRCLGLDRRVQSMKDRIEELEAIVPEPQSWAGKFMRAARAR